MEKIWQRPEAFIDIGVIIIVIVVVIFLILKFVGGRKPLLGMGLAGGVGLLGYFLVRKRLKRAFDVEKQIAAFNDSMAKFKDKQKTRYQAVTANQEVINTLEQQKKKLKKKGDQYETEIALIDKEIQDRQNLNSNLLERTEDFLAQSSERSADRRALLDSLADKFSPIPDDADVAVGDAPEKITIDGFQLLEG